MARNAFSYLKGFLLQNPILKKEGNAFHTIFYNSSYDGSYNGSYNGSYTVPTVPTKAPRVCAFMLGTPTADPFHQSVSSMEPMGVVKNNTVMISTTRIGRSGGSEEEADNILMAQPIMHHTPSYAAC